MFRILWPITFVFLINCVGNSKVNQEGYNLINSDYGYFKFKTSLFDGNVSIRSKIFQDTVGCYSDYDCSPKSFWVESGAINGKNPNFPLELTIGSYYAISRIHYIETQFYDCKVSELKIYHGFQFKSPFDPFKPLEFYDKDQCEVISENSLVCPRMDITKKGILEFELSKGQIRNNNISIRHLFEGPYAFGLIFGLTYCGLVFDSIDFIDVKVKRYE
ncbi:hypothetical protein EHQ68_04650 [Leptospira congkakensis]|uniref:Uncharacterized protein n=1 Tax=Leptospira congkakensis TaxID=2484932 RepID=A0A4Z1A6U4_9LEPT|nr:hypothetical protein [Leptospira congkakensis]TGL90718.1 hypothetical protein EHQ69_12410 [Leptospira congkakensis]TGL91725.1 hypothetical protein EHQ68_04650 [Leptospira congkakensis]TGL98779.1 hypothetical protein EHQ70_04240 [Leptospira congkakensis]